MTDDKNAGTCPLCTREDCPGAPRFNGICPRPLRLCSSEATHVHSFGSNGRNRCACGVTPSGHFRALENAETARAEKALRSAEARPLQVSAELFAAVVHKAGGAVTLSELDLVNSCGLLISGETDPGSGARTFTTRMRGRERAPAEVCAYFDVHGTDEALCTCIPPEVEAAAKEIHDLHGLKELPNASPVQRAAYWETRCRTAWARLKELTGKDVAEMHEADETREQLMDRLGITEAQVLEYLSHFPGARSTPTPSAAWATHREPGGNYLTRAAYADLVAEDLAWLEKQPRTLEREHIRVIVETSVDGLYPAATDSSCFTREQAIRIAGRWLDEHFPRAPQRIEDSLAALLVETVGQKGSVTR